MTTGILKHQIVSWLLKANRHRRQGFTLIELLVSIIVGSIIVSALLFLVTELNRFNGREELLTQTQQDMRRALDFISSDVSEAVFVYTDPSAIATQLTDDPMDTIANGAIPILAFWRLDPVNTAGLPADCSTTSNEAECTTLKVRQSAYTLVVYFQTNDNTDSPIWEGDSRIIRYQLPKYSNVATLASRAGYEDPSLENTTFASWARNGASTDGESQTLTDFVSLPDSGTTACPAGDFVRTPATSDSFYVCVRSGEAASSAEGFDEELLNRTNQSVFIALRGNAARANNDVLVGQSGEAGRLPTLESEVLIRGVIEKPR